ncbi:hypothetical protein [Leptolyngbya sp. FACHB-261]|uniref:hypothetical protein n=1 Tax=Leptolyngbya sp. FACHB-261 TaxID=2692806 RepID=UPI0016843578|nr:hypothetical protein [Leptolyngbya sp. FACHB-261]MBD2104200.1 hypothetical protein [Leptolyngbya sp. FACHB-261]
MIWSVRKKDSVDTSKSRPHADYKRRREDRISEIKKEYRTRLGEVLRQIEAEQKSIEQIENFRADLELEEQYRSLVENELKIKRRLSQLHEEVVEIVNIEMPPIPLERTSEPTTTEPRSGPVRGVPNLNYHRDLAAKIRKALTEATVVSEAFAQAIPLWENRVDLKRLKRRPSGQSEFEALAQELANALNRLESDRKRKFEIRGTAEGFVSFIYDRANDQQARVGSPA